MVKPVNPRRHIIVYMPIELLMFLIQKNILHLWIDTIIKKLESIQVTAPQFIRALRYNESFYYDAIWLAASQVKDRALLDKLDEEWMNIQQQKLL